ncbi:unnamed protein product [Periconia digitata]|uniref:HTH La-type RNA-binding domain-containing protein n=1 Tax=Periconia digitata TaxID=1303443 RepID=A0A9W4XEH1_9PLEO|nr:unnamed protein product [Periconia digitata]
MTTLLSPAAISSSTEPAAMEDHPQGPAIRKQVEYYFSDENLPTDLHLLQCCGGRKNLPVSISRICGFKKMRGFKPKSGVVNALRKSSFLVVSNDGKLITRKVPLEGPCALDPDFYDEEEIAYDPRIRVPAVHPVPLLPQTKTQHPPGVTKGQLKPSGFEDNYVEAPITPAEAEEDDAMYHPDKPFVERIELAIQRFKQKRRMREEYALIFTRWMRFGGVDSGPRMFGTLSKQEMAEMNAEQIARATATHSVPWDREDENKWIVDFFAVAKAFLSSDLPVNLGLSPTKIKTGCQVLRSFYNFLLYHTVCPEYRDNIEAARGLCNIAERELSKIDSAGHSLPGSFNNAASTVVGGSKSETYTGNRDWAVQARRDGLDIVETGVNDETARIVFMSGIALMGTFEQQKNLKGVDDGKVKVVEDKTIGLEVMSIALSTSRIRELYDRQNQICAPKIRLEALGTLSCRFWKMPDYVEYDLPMEKYPNGRPVEAEEDKMYEFWVEDSILHECFTGMKLRARILTLEEGVRILDDVKEVMPSFYTWLPNELEAGRHGPKEVVVRGQGAQKIETGNDNGESRNVAENHLDDRGESDLEE